MRLNSFSRPNWEHSALLLPFPGASTATARAAVLGLSPQGLSLLRGSWTGLWAAFEPGPLWFAEGISLTNQQLLASKQLKSSLFLNPVSCLLRPVPLLSPARSSGGPCAAGSSACRPGGGSSPAAWPPPSPAWPTWESTKGESRSRRTASQKGSTRPAAPRAAFSSQASPTATRLLKYFGQTR